MKFYHFVNHIKTESIGPFVANSKLKTNRNNKKAKQQKMKSSRKMFMWDDKSARQLFVIFAEIGWFRALYSYK